VCVCVCVLLCELGIILNSNRIKKKRISSGQGIGSQSSEEKYGENSWLYNCVLMNGINISIHE